MEKIYYKWRYSWTNNNSRYTPSYYFLKTFADTVEKANITMQDNLISDDDYIWLKRFGIIEFDETKITKENLEYDLYNSRKDNHIKILSVNESITFLDIETTIEKQGTNQYKARKAYINEMWIEVPDLYITID